MVIKGEDSLSDDLAGRRPFRVIDGPSLSGHHHHHHHHVDNDNNDDHDEDKNYMEEPTKKCSHGCSSLLEAFVSFTQRPC